MFNPTNLINMDLDGVLVNLEKGIELALKNAVSSKDIERAELYGRKNDLFWPYFEEAVKNECFIKAPALDFTEDFKNLIIPSCKEKNITVRVLTSITGNMTKYHEEIKRQKKEWLISQGIGDLEVIFVKGSYLKQDYASPGHLLIDDYFPNIEQFRSKGGIAIHHVTSEDTLNKIKLIEPF